MMKVKTYSELRSLRTLEERYQYLKLSGSVGGETFGFERYINQTFYKSREWRQIRHHVIFRDNACDLGIEGYEIRDRVYVHHLNPMTSIDIIGHDNSILDPEFLIATTHRTHNAIHYGDERMLPKAPVVRFPGDTKLW